MFMTLDGVARILHKNNPDVYIDICFNKWEPSKTIMMQREFEEKCSMLAASALSYFIEKHVDGD
jgi:hypothetical protein